MQTFRTSLCALLATIMCGLAGCGDGAADYDWFTYAAPDGWAKYEPPSAIILPPTLVEFRLTGEDQQNAPVLEIRDVTADLHRMGCVPGRYTYTRELEWRAACARAEQEGRPAPLFECIAAPDVVEAEGLIDGYAIRFERDGTERGKLVYFIDAPDGRCFRALYHGAEPRFSEHVRAITASLQTLAFPTPESAPAPLPEAAVVAALTKELDDERLWLYDGQVEGRRLNDEHLRALADPAFAQVTDLNFISGHAATSDGVDVTDAGLAHITHLPLTSLCMRGSVVTDAGLAQLKDLRLQTLVLADTLVEGEGLRHLAGMPIRAIDLESTRVDDDDLEHLIGLPLISVNLRNTRVTDAGRARLAQRLPQRTSAPKDAKSVDRRSLSLSLSMSSSLRFRPGPGQGVAALVDVRILLPGVADQRLVELASFTYYSDMTECGVRLFRYRERFMHQKVILVDEKVAGVGTVNLDNRSLYLNFEETALVADVGFASEVEAMLEADLAACDEVDVAHFDGKPLRFRAAARIARLASPFCDRSGGSAQGRLLR